MRGGSQKIRVQLSEDGEIVLYGLKPQMSAAPPRGAMSILRGVRGGGVKCRWTAETQTTAKGKGFLFFLIMYS